MIDGVELRDAVPGDGDAVLQLLAAAHGTGVRDRASWDWLFGEQLHGYVVADAGDRLAAQYALRPLRVVHRGERLEASLSLDTATHPDYAGRGLMTELGALAYARAGDGLVVGFPNPRSSGVLYNRLGWTELTPFPLLFRPLRAFPGAFAPWPRLTGDVRLPASVEPFDRFGGWTDAIWARTAEALTAAVVHDAAYLNWRFCDGPVRYERYLARAGGEPAAFAVLRTVAWKRSRVSYLLELAGDERGAAAALEAALGAARSAGAAAVVALASPSDPLTPVLAASGFRRPPARALRGFSFGVRLGGGVAARRELADPRAWRISAADFDHV